MPSQSINDERRGCFRNSKMIRCSRACLGFNNNAMKVAILRKINSHRKPSITQTGTVNIIFALLSVSIGMKSSVLKHAVLSYEIFDF